MSRPSLIFDCDGVLAETELQGHLPAFNETFAELGLPLRWDVERYGELLAVGGGRERMLHALTPELIRSAGLPEREDLLEAESARWHAHKTRIFTERIAAGEISPRSGVGRLAGEALAAGWNVAVASTSAEASVRAVMRVAFDPEIRERIRVYPGEIVARKKPDPEVYLAALADLGGEAGRAVAVEDSRNGLLAACAAGIPCVVTRSAFTQKEPMDEAVLVLSELGDPGREPPRVEVNRTGVPLRGPVTLAALESCLAPAPT